MKVLIARCRQEAGCLCAAVSYLTRLPVSASAPTSLAGAVKYLPLIGLLVGGVGALVFHVAAMLWPSSIAVLFAIGTMSYLTGALHEDGLADMCDGLGGGWDKAKILAIMKDSRVGSFGVLGLIVVIGLKSVTLMSMAVDRVIPALIAGQVISRACASLIVACLEYAREDETSKAAALTQRLSIPAVLFVLLTVCATLLVSPISGALPGCAAAVMVTIWLALKFRRWLGGYTGDCLGGVQQSSELAFYLGVSATLAAV